MFPEYITENVDAGQVKAILEKIRQVRVAVYGDFCLDVYWLMDPEGSEISVETGLRAESVQHHYYSPGGASNVVANLAALRPAGIRVIGVTGNDLFGRELRDQFRRMKVNMDSLFFQEEAFDTYAFVKKYYGEEEQPRIDFGLKNVRSPVTEDLIIDGIERALETDDVIIVNQQVPGSITGDRFIWSLNRLFQKFRDRFILLDTRHHGGQFRDVCLKTNYKEQWRSAVRQPIAGEVIPMDRISDLGQERFREIGKPVFITCGERGIITVDKKGIHHTRGLQILKKIDPVGAGDTVLSALALALGAGFEPPVAAGFANLAAGVTIQKLFTTGTASPEEVLEMSRDPDYFYNTDLAETGRAENFLQGTGIEVCEKSVYKGPFPIKHVVFDHDGTLSTLRKGWELVMEEFMIRMLTGCSEGEEGNPEFSEARERVREYIGLSTGLRTILQMKELVNMIKESGQLPDHDGFSAEELKKRYLQDLMKTVDNRLKKLETGEYERNRFTIPGVMEMLKELRNRGLILYLVSGTDEPDVKKEAGILGYGDLFEGRIFGSRDDMPGFSKKQLLGEIVSGNGLGDHELLVFGDGPVEIRECRKRKGIGVGMATREDDTGGIDAGKRRRLIRAGAHLVMPDYLEGKDLLKRIIR